MYDKVVYLLSKGLERHHSLMYSDVASGATQPSMTSEARMTNDAGVYFFSSLSRQNDDLRAKVASFDGLKEMHEKERTELKLTIKKLVSWFPSLHGGTG